QCRRTRLPRRQASGPGDAFPEPRDPANAVCIALPKNEVADVYRVFSRGLGVISKNTSKSPGWGDPPYLERSIKTGRIAPRRGSLERVQGARAASEPTEVSALVEIEGEIVIGIRLELIEPWRVGGNIDLPPPLELKDSKVALASVLFHL